MLSLSPMLPFHLYRWLSHSCCLFYHVCCRHSHYWFRHCSLSLVRELPTVANCLWVLGTVAGILNYWCLFLPQKRKSCCGIYHRARTLCCLDTLLSPWTFQLSCDMRSAFCDSPCTPTLSSTPHHPDSSHSVYYMEVAITSPFHQEVLIYEFLISLIQ